MQRKAPERWTTAEIPIMDYHGFSVEIRRDKRVFALRRGGEEKQAKRRQLTRAKRTDPALARE